MTARDKDSRQPDDSPAPLDATLGRNPSTQPGLSTRRLLLSAAGIALRERKTLRGLGLPITNPELAVQSNVTPQPEAAPPAAESGVHVHVPVTPRATTLADTYRLPPSAADAWPDDDASEERSGTVRKPPRQRRRPSTRLLLSAAAIGLLALLMVSAFWQVDVTGRGALRSPGGSRTLVAGLAGTIETIDVRSGAKLRAGQRLLTLRAADTQNELDQARREEAVVAERAHEVEAKRDLHERNATLLRTDLRLLQRRVRNSNAALDGLSHKLADEQPDTEGRNTLNVQIRHAELDRQAQEQQLARTQLQLETLERERSEQLQHAQSDLTLARSKAQWLASSLTRSELRAPVDGDLEGLDVQVGDQVQSHQALASLFTQSTPTSAVVFVEERERSALRIGAPARLEVDQLPSAQFGTLTGHVSGLSAHTANTRELQSNLADGPACRTHCFRVEITLDLSARNRKLLQQLATGAPVTARLSLRQRRVIDLWREWIAD